MKVEFSKKQLIILFVVGFYLAATLGMNILVMKSIQIGTISVFACGLLLTPFAFACNDIITECAGEQFAFKIVIAGAITSLVWVILCTISIALPGNNEYISEAFSTILGSTWRITSASLIAYVCGGYINNKIMSNLHNKDGEHKYYKRAIISTLFGQMADDYIFCLLAFAPLGISTIENPWMACITMPLISAIAETVIEACVTPVSKKICDTVKK